MHLDHEEKIVNLLATMETLYSFVSTLESSRSDSETLQTSVKDVVQMILKQTLECILVIQEYSGHGFSGVFPRSAPQPVRLVTLIGKLLRQTFDTFDKKIEQFEKAFVSLADSFDTVIDLQTNFVSLRINCKVDGLGSSYHGGTSFVTKLMSDS